MKKKIASLLFKVYAHCLKLKRGKTLKILLYTDSRGYNVISRFGKNPFTSYVSRLVKKYDIDFCICPEKFTTIVDFISFVKSAKWKSYDFVIMHCGVVDFSPRPLSNISKVKESKHGSEPFEKLFRNNQEHYKNYAGIKYYEEDVVTLYSKEYLQQEIGPELKLISNLIWIDSNNFVKGWEGNFARGRPKNINEEVNKYDEALFPFVKNRISLKNWNDQQIKQFTIDNIHFTDAGFVEITRLINEKIKELSISS